MQSFEIVRTIEEYRQNINDIESEATPEERFTGKTPYSVLTETARVHGGRPGSSFQMFSDPTSKAYTLTWSDVHAQVTQVANLFRSLGANETNSVAYLLPGLNEAVVTVLGAMTASKALPINPLLEPEIIAGILREGNAKVLVTLKAFPKVELAEVAAKAVAMAPNVDTIVEIDLLPNLTGLKRLIVPLIRPKMKTERQVQVLDFHKELARQPKDRLTFEESTEDRVCGLFHTGGTTGVPKLVRHRNSGALYNAWTNATFVFSEDATALCPLPLFHVMGVYAILMPVMMAGGHMVQVTPAGYRGDGVFDNIWKVIERWNVNFLVTVPTAAAMKLNVPIDADISSLKVACSGSAPFPTHLFNRFQEAVGVPILEGYGMTEATCMISGNPFDAPRKIGSVGMPTPYTRVMILSCQEDGTVIQEHAAGSAGEICIKGPGVATGDTYTQGDMNVGQYAKLGNELFLRTGDLGYFDDDGFLWITGRAKDLILRGGHNIDPLLVEEALASNDKVSFVGAIGQPDKTAGEVPAAYVELVAGASATADELLEYAAEHIQEHGAVPKYIEIMEELPKTAVGKVFKPALRKSAVKRIFEAEFAEAGIDASVERVEDIKKRGLVAYVSGNATDAEIMDTLGDFVPQWERS
ncbi:Long-chain-fatty-acid--CoA ligase [Falsiruegeria litorea R37]|uniref:Long-chain-fatty-acid--CoA ligase n=1 Tax=Falsiruegeria litorea R37 TaxID=1200284 RepID=A0A1Y5SW27_9RHOB|nr:acyl-CoA synthetase [Falsiruegeria litorea]SLN46346.1 Long-chain-fatty-acid--CoA ligase [Falsiruegeria litorea R37]